MSISDNVLGKPLDRVDGALKVTGAARYSADMPVRDLVYGVMVMSTVGRGRIKKMEVSEAEHAPGVLAVFTPFNAPRVGKGSIQAQGANDQQDTPRPAGSADSGGDPKSAAQRRPPDRKIHLLQEDTIFYNGQPIGVVVADTLERAIHATKLVRTDYVEEKPATQIDRELRHAYMPKGAGGGQSPPDSRQGDFEQGRRNASEFVDVLYSTPVETHNAMEPHATIAVWEDDHLTLYDATQGIFGARKRIADLFEIPPNNVRIVSHFVGGGFGSKGPVWSHVALAAMTARAVGRPVKLVLERRQMFGPIGFRGETRQKLRLGAASDGKLTVVSHDSVVETSVFDEFIEPAGLSARMLYSCANISTSHRAVRLNIGTPSFTRAPGEAPGVFALEAAMDELASRLKMDPVEFRLKNHAESDPESGKPWSSKSLRECYRQGAERFGWSRRTAAPRSMRDGRTLIGYGMASATYPTRRSPASALARMMPDGRALVQSGSQDIGTGTYTVMTQIAAEALGLPPERVRFELGDTNLPETPNSGGSQTAASTGSAVFLAAQGLRTRLIEMAASDAMSPLHGADPADIAVEDGRLASKADPGKADSYAALVTRSGRPSVDARVDAKPGDEQQRFSMHAFGAHFAEVHVDPDLGQIRVARFVSAFGAGRILNAKTARNQFMGGITWGIGMALMEQTLMDPRTGRIMNADLAEYHVPVNADVPNIEVIFVEEHDPYVNPIGVKGIGEIGIVGVPAAIANAVYHATGTRVRDLPITLDKLL